MNKKRIHSKYGYKQQWVRAAPMATFVFINTEMVLSDCRLHTVDFERLVDAHQTGTDS